MTWYQKNREQALAYAREYYQAHKAERIRYWKKYYQQHKEERKAYTRGWESRNKEKAREYRRKSYEAKRKTKEVKPMEKNQKLIGLWRRTEESMYNKATHRDVDILKDNFLYLAKKNEVYIDSHDWEEFLNSDTSKEMSEELRKEISSQINEVGDINIYISHGLEE